MPIPILLSRAAPAILQLLDYLTKEQTLVCTLFSSCTLLGHVVLSWKLLLTIQRWLRMSRCFSVTQQAKQSVRCLCFCNPAPQCLRGFLFFFWVGGSFILNSELGKQTPSLSHGCLASLCRKSKFLLPVDNKKVSSFEALTITPRKSPL